jgi:hypothetical protein
MTDLSSNISFLFTLTGVEGEFYVNTYQNVRKNIGNIVYLETPPKDAVKLAYVASKEISPKDNISIGDRSSSLYNNVISSYKTEFKSYSNNVTLKVKNFLVTQVVNTSDSGDVPLYFKYVFKENYSTIDRSSVKVFDRDFNEVPSSNYRLVLTYNYSDNTGKPTTPSHYTLYNSLESSYDEQTAEYDIFFIQYVSTAGATNEIKTFILNNELAYKESTFSDYWHIDNNLKPWTDTYSFDEDSLVLSASKNLPVYIKYENQKKLSLLYPLETSDNIPWFFRVTNGAFNSQYYGWAIHYRVKEFNNQAFNPIAPYKLAVRAKCQIISKDLIKFPHTQVQSSSFFGYTDIEVEDKDGNILYAVTDNPTKVGNDYFDFSGKRRYDSNNSIIRWRNDILSGFDAYTGICLFNIELDTDYKVFATYSYKEDKYTLTSLNMNPIFDNLVASEICTVYMIPVNCPTQPFGSQVQSINWVRSDASGIIRATNQNSESGNTNLSKDVVLSDNNGYSIDGILGLHYNRRATTTSPTEQIISLGAVINVTSTSLFPDSAWIRFLDTDGRVRYAKYVSKTETSFTLSSGETQCPSSTNIKENSFLEVVNFIDERTTLTNRSHDIEIQQSYKTDGASAKKTIPVHISRYFVLGETTVIPSHGISDLAIMDVRENGGGIRKEKYEEAKLINPKATWYNDSGNFEGQLIPGRAVVVIRLPVSIKKKFTEQQIQDIVEENIVFGTMPVIQYYGYEPEITLIENFSDITGGYYTSYGIGYI